MPDGRAAGRDRTTLAAGGLSIAAGTLRTLRPAAAAAVAAVAGFGAIGVRFDTAAPEPGEFRCLRSVLDATGLGVLDVEVVRIVPGDDPEAAKRLCGWGAEIGARFLLVVSEDPDRGRTVARFAETGWLAAEHGMRAVLEFMRFTSVRTLSDAVGVVADAGAPGAGVLVDALHLARCGDEPGALAAVAPELLPYVQLCDARAVGPSDAELAFEARHARLMPGDGQLPLGALLQAVPADAAISVEVLSDDGDARPGIEVARRAIEAVGRLFGQSSQGPSDGAVPTAAALALEPMEVDRWT